MKLVQNKRLRKRNGGWTVFGIRRPYLCAALHVLLVTV